MPTQSHTEDNLKKYLSGGDYKAEDSYIEKEEKKILQSTKDLEYHGLSIDELPCAAFYPSGTSVFIRPAKVKEIQAYSTVDETNFYDILEKVNQMLSSCVFLKYPDGTRKPYTYIVDGDRWYLLFAISELTFPNGSKLYTETKTDKIPIERKYFEFHKMDEKLAKYYDRVGGKFIFPTKSGDVEMAPPTIGLQKSFAEFMVKEVQNKRELDQSFLKIIPYTLPNRTSITEEGISKKLLEFKTMGEKTGGDKLFNFLNTTVEKMSFGIKGVAMLNESGMEVRSDDIFPKGVKGLFLSTDWDDDFLIS